MNEQAIKDMSVDWYNKLDVHAPMIEILPLLSPDGLEMKFPEATLTTMAEFEGWYQGVIRIFFDEVHIVRKNDVTFNEDGSATVDIVVHWEASVWKPPARNSARISLEAYQTWIVVPGPENQPLVKFYSVDKLEYNEGSALL
jgi:hypothetical protein